MKQRKPLSNSQIACIILLWILLVIYILIYSKEIDGLVIVSIIMSAAFVFIPIYQSIKKRKK